MADQGLDKVTETVAKDEEKALKSAEAAFAAASEEIAKPVKAAVEAPAKVAEAVAEAAPALARKAPAKARKAKPAAKPAVAKAPAKVEAKSAAKPAAARAAAKPAKPAPKRKIVARKTIKQAPVRKAAAATNQGVKTMTTKTNKTAENMFGADRFQAAFGEINERAKAASEKGAKLVEDMTDLTRGNVEAMVASSKVAQKGLETLTQTAADYGRKSIEDAQNAFKSFGEIRSATDLFKLQGDFARSAFDAAIAESARVSEAMLKIANDAAEPITSRYTVAAERVKTLVAA